MDANYEEIMKRLREPFSSREIEWKIQVTTKDKTRGMAVAYMDARAVQKRLDEAVGPFNWKNVYSLWHDNAQICGISIFHMERKEWVTKFDGAENSDIEPVKGGLSDSFKRAATVWGIGRYLYEMDGVWVEIESRGKSYAIAQDQYSKLEKEYNAAVRRMSDMGDVQQGVSSGKSPDTRAAGNAGAGKSTDTHAARNGSTGKTPPSSGYDYIVRSIRPSGKASQVLELADRSGSTIKAYIRAADQSIQAGARLNNVRIERKNSSYGEYNLISAYQLAA